MIISKNVVTVGSSECFISRAGPVRAKLSGDQ